MIIEKVELIDFRSHKNSKIEFTQGINLLLGLNGAGKSSILDAIAYTLWGESDTNSIAKGKNQARIRVTFTANDEKRYIVEKVMGKSASHKIFNEGEKTPFKSGSKIIAEFVKNCTGIKSNNSKEIFDSVIVAKQNSITEVFSLQPFKRAEFFNKVFETEIYKKIAENIKNDTLRNFKTQKNYNDELILNLVGKIVDVNILQTDLDNINSTLQSENSKFEKLKDDLSSVSFIIQKHNDLQNKIQNEELTHSHIIKMNDLNQSNLLSKNNDLQKALDSCGIIDELKPIYDNYIKLREEDRDLKSRILELEKKEKQRIAAEKKLLEIENETNIINNKLENTNKIIEDINTQISIDKISINDFESNINSKSDQINLISKNYNQFSFLLNEFKTSLEEYNKIKNSIDNQIELIDKYKTNLENLDDLESQLNLINNEIKKIDIDLEAKKSINLKIQNLKDRINDNLDAQKQLSNGLCPILQENCKNITEDSKSNYFESKHDKLSQDLNQFNIQLLDYVNSESQKQVLISEKSNIEIRIKNYHESSKNIELAAKDLEIKSLKCDVINANLAKKIIDMDIVINDNENYSLIRDIAIDKLNDIANNRSIIETELLSLKKQFDDLNLNISKNQNKLNSLKNDISDFIQKTNEIAKIKHELTQKIQELDNTLINFEEYKSKSISLSEELNKLQVKYDIYIANIEIASMKDEILADIKSIESEIERNQETLRLVNQNLEKMKAEFNPKEYDEAKDLKKQIENDTENCRQKLTSLKVDMNNKLRDIENNNELILKHDEYLQINEILTKKIALSEIFINRLKDMGQLVANRVLKSIEPVATDNYRLISGTNDCVLWSNEEGNNYQVFLSIDGSMENARKFEQLSGGEQVSLALSIRAALNLILSGADFAAFDEPTVNLDLERRAALADSLSKLLKSMKQAIIITHDDTFREMAQNTIFLSKTRSD